MDSWRDDENPVCPSCAESLSRTAIDCPACGTTLVDGVDSDVLDEHMAAAFARDHGSSPRWAVVLTGLALGIAIAPLVAYSVVILLGGLSVWELGSVLIAGWLTPALYLARFPNPSAVLARGLYLVVTGVVAVILTLAIDVTSGGSAVSIDQFWIALFALALPAVVAMVLARRVADRATRQLRGEPGPLHERAGISPDEEERVD